MDIFGICRTCLNKSNAELISIHSFMTNDDDFTTTDNLQANSYRISIATILDELTGYKYKSSEFPYPEKICETCLNDLKIVYDFKHRCEIAFDELTKFAEDTNRLNEPQILIESKPDVIVTEFESIEINENNPIKVGDFAIKDELENDQPSVNIFHKIRSKATIKTENKSTTSNLKHHQCTECDRVFSRPTHLRRHMTIHTDERAYACKLCDKKFRRADHLKAHQNFHSQIKPHTCSQCGGSFSRAEHLRRHILCRHKKEPKSFGCSVCDYEAETVRDLNQHKKSHADTVYSCKICDVQCKTRPELSEHSKVHGDERPYLCSECGMRFVRNDYLVIHMRRHKGEKPYKCRFCERAFPRATDLTVHERYHTNDKKHKCNVCGKEFHRAYNLTVHMRVHTGEKPYQCPHCSRSFSQGNDLKAHIRRHTGERYPCEICGTSFIQLYLLNNHKKNMHGIEARSNISRITKLDSSNYSESMMSHAATLDQPPTDAAYTECVQNEC